MADDLSILDDLDVKIDEDAPTIRIDPETGTIEEPQEDGSVIVKLDAGKPGVAGDPEEWYANLVEKVGDLKLSGMKNDLIEGIKADDMSRQQSLQTAVRGLDLLGLKIESPSSDVSTSTSGVPGMSKVTNPLLLEACLKGWANAQAELLPSSGPVKIEDDGDESQTEDEQAERLERGFNHYLTTTATEYYPDTSQMLLWGVYFKGSGFKKIYRCPMRRRPVSESVDAKDLIVSDASKDLRSCGRITHQILMRPSVFRRMQMIGAYRKTSAAQPSPEANPVDEKIAGIQGTTAMPDRPEDKPYTIWETQCELDLDEFIPKSSKFKGERIPLPYVVTIDKDNEEILALRRDWAEDDEHCMRQRMYVRYYYVPGPGFYCTGMLNIVGNASAAMTAAWREALDAGQFANFPAGLIAELGGRQNNMEMQLSPGEWKLIKTNGQPISQMAMPLPYKDVTPGLLTLIDKITEQAKGLTQSAEMPVGEGMKDIPVGSMLAQIEQASKIMAAAHKGMHQSMSEEIELLIDLFRRHPQDFLDSNPDKDEWSEESLLDALDNVSLVPKSDPNVPSHIHRVAKALGLVQLMGNPVFGPRLNPDEVLRRVLNAMREDPKGLQIPAPPTPPQDNLDGQAKVMKAQAALQDSQTKAAEVSSTERMHETDLAKEVVIHQADEDKVKADLVKGHMELAAKTHLDNRELNHRIGHENRTHALETAKVGLAAQDQAHQQSMGVAEHVTSANQEARKADLETHKALNPPKPAAKPTPKKGK